MCSHLNQPALEKRKELLSIVDGPHCRFIEGTKEAARERCRWRHRYARLLYKVNTERVALLLH